MLKRKPVYTPTWLLLLLFLCLQQFVTAQLGPNEPQFSYAVLPGASYTITQISGSTSLPFVPGGTLQPSVNADYWLKIIIANPGHTGGQYNLFVEPSVLNTLYYFDTREQKWISSSSGAYRFPGKARQQLGAMPFVLNNQSADTLYVKMSLAAIKSHTAAIKPLINIEESNVTDSQQDTLLYSWVATLAVLFFFFLYNLYLYGSFKDVSVLYYLIAQVGAMVYVTGYGSLSRLFLPVKIFAIFSNSNGVITYYSVDSIFQHLGSMLIILGYVHLTRAYLNTAYFFPRLNRLFIYGLYTYLAIASVFAFVNIFFFYIDAYSLLYENILMLLLVSLIIYTSALGYRRRLRAAGPFLLANILPLAFIVIITLFHIFISMHDDTVWLPSLAIVSQAFCFSVALVTRTRLIQADLNAKELEAQQLTFEVQKISITIQAEKARTELLQERLDANQRELTSTTLYLVQKNEMLATLRSQIEELNKLYPKAPHTRLSGMESVLRSSLNLDDDWQKFKLHFERLHPNFFEELKAKHPALTHNEVRLCAYFHINLSPKEIAALLNIEPDSVRRAKSRLLKKMGMAEVPDVTAIPGDDK